jgi:hypothetical protein
MQDACQAFVNWGSFLEVLIVSWKVCSHHMQCSRMWHVNRKMQDISVAGVVDGVLHSFAPMLVHALDKYHDTSISRVGHAVVGSVLRVNLLWKPLHCCFALRLGQN